MNFRMMNLTRESVTMALLSGQQAIGSVAVIAILAGSVHAADETPSVPADHAARMQAGVALFKQHVRPVLIKHCLECHGGKSTKADFDLATRKALVDSGMIDKTAADSYLFALITHAEEPHMPFKQPKLPAETIAHIARWIELGAPYDQPLAEQRAADGTAMRITETDREFWSFRPLQTPVLPAVKDASWSRTPIDRFILAELEKRGIAPNSAADRRTLIRRAYFDLIGLPPTSEEVAAFVADTDPEAYGKLIDRLLDSPHYGERWARHWMDVARFAESHGYEQDYDRPHAYHYRDFLIRALNADMPYDQFVRWQLAGDELAPGDPMALAATGFLGAGAFPTQLTEMEFESARYDELDDMTATTGVAVLGLSIGCARCHDHKFDPIPTRDYYRLASSFTTTIRSEINVDLHPEENSRRRRDYEAELRNLETAQQRFRQSLGEQLLAWLDGADLGSAAVGTWEPMDVKSVESTAGTKFVRQQDDSWLAMGDPPAKEVLTIVAETSTASLRGFRLEALTHESLPHGGPGRASNGNFALGDFRAAARPRDAEQSPAPITFAAARATHQQNMGSLSVAASIDEDPVSGWAVDSGGIGKDQAAVFETADPVEFPGGAQVTFTLTFNHPNTRHTLGRFRLTATRQAAAKPVIGGADQDPTLREALAAVKRTRDLNSPAGQKALDWFARQRPEFVKRAQQLAELRKQGPQLQLSKMMVCSEGFPHMQHHADGRGFPHFYPQTFILERGDIHQKQDVAKPGYLQVLMRGDRPAEFWKVDPPAGWDRTSFRRTSLANWLTDPEYGAGHLSARVIVNRLWHHHFGRGIVATPNDFGFQGERPTHPELLDWLAGDLIANGWKLKRLHKLIMTSSVYLQNGTFDEHRARIDRENVYFWRRPPRRLEAEAVRDAMLAVSGQLDRTMFGPGTLDANMRRRSVYFFIKRSQLIPMMMLFDWPEHLVSIGRRAVTTTAPQALMFMNSPQGRQYAAQFAQRIETADPAAAVERGYQLAFGRSPNERELARGREFLIAQAAAHKSAGKTRPDALALTDFCQTLLSINEFVYVE